MPSSKLRPLFGHIFQSNNLTTRYDGDLNIDSSLFLNLISLLHNDLFTTILTERFMTTDDSFNRLVILVRLTDHFLSDFEFPFLDEKYSLRHVSLAE